MVGSVKFCTVGGIQASDKTIFCLIIATLVANILLKYFDGAIT